LAYSKSKINQNKGLPEQFERAQEIQDSIDDITGLSRTHYSLAEYYLINNETSLAHVQAEKSLRYAEKADNHDRILETLQLLTKVDPKNSSAYNQRYITLNDSLQEDERQVRNKFARIRFETDEYIAENEMLASEKRLWAGIAIAIFLLGASAYFMLDQRAKNQKLRFQQAQQAANQEIFNLMLAQKEKEEEGKKSEQKRISEELHDGVLGRLMGSRMVLTGLNQKSDSDAEAQRQKAIDALQEVEEEIRAISHELSHSSYRKMHNYMGSLQDLLKTVESASNIDCHLVYDDEKDWDALKGEVKINAYRMIQESLQNSVKHAQCQNATVTFGLEENILKIDITDDGKGFRPKRRKKGIGMRNIASRMEKLNGKWHIDSAPGKGTTVALRIPVTCFKTKDAVSRSAGRPQLAEKV
jgi:signal transduction histidine kinase